MLSKAETRVMGVLYEECFKKRAALLSPHDLAKKAGGELTASETEKIVGDLASDGYVDFVYSDRRGETVFCVSLTEKGKGFPRSVKMIKRNLIFRLGLTAVFAALSFVIGLILRAVFSG